jgi:uncharacterized protein with HEPN domain
MRPSEPDTALIWDMLQAARYIVEFVRDVKWSRFEGDRMLRSAVERQVMIIGEAARKISVAFRAAHPEIGWKGMIGQRNVLAHEYGEVLVERVWLMATLDAPALIRLLEPLVPAEDKA